MPDIYDLKYDNGEIHLRHLDPTWLDEAISTGDRQDDSIVASWDGAIFESAENTVLRVRVYPSEGWLLVEESPWFMVCDQHSTHGVSDLLSTKNLNGFGNCPPPTMFNYGNFPNTIYTKGARLLCKRRNVGEQPRWFDREGHSDQSEALVRRGWGIFDLDSVHPELEGWADDPLARFAGDDTGAMIDCWLGASNGDPLCLRALRYLRWINPMEFLQIVEAAQRGISYRGENL